MAYCKTQHSRWQLGLKDDHLSGPSLTHTVFTGQRCTENVSEAKKSPPLSLNRHPLFSDMHRLCFKSSSLFVEALLLVNVLTLASVLERQLM